MHEKFCSKGFKYKSIIFDSVSGAGILTDVNVTFNKNLKLSRVYIKNMVCGRCIMVVRDIFTRAGVPPVSVSLGEVETTTAPDRETMNEIEARLSAAGFEILEDKKRKLVEKIKRIVIRQVRQEEGDTQSNFSAILSGELSMEYSAISKLFSELENITLEKFIIEQKVERAKELLVYGEMNLNEIAFKMGYSSAAHLSSQFKKVTGFSPMAFRKLKDHQRKPIDGI